jgi:hypothetical protein
MLPHGKDNKLRDAYLQITGRNQTRPKFGHDVAWRHGAVSDELVSEPEARGAPDRGEPSQSAIESRRSEGEDSSYGTTLNALTVGMLAMARSMRVAAVPVWDRSWAKRGPAIDWEMPWMRVRIGTAERTTRVLTSLPNRRRSRRPSSTTPRRTSASPVRRSTSFLRLSASASLSCKAGASFLARSVNPLAWPDALRVQM